MGVISSRSVDEGDGGGAWMELVMDGREPTARDLLMAPRPVPLVSWLCAAWDWPSRASSTSLPAAWWGGCWISRSGARGDRGV